MSGMKCTCGGTYLSLGSEYIRTGAVEKWSFGVGYSQNDWTESCIPGELFACDTCRAVKFCADYEWITQRLASKAAEKATLTEEEKLAERRETVIQSYMKDFAGHKREKLEKIVEQRTFTKYPDEALEAARRVLAQKPAGPEL